MGLDMYLLAKDPQTELIDEDPSENVSAEPEWIKLHQWRKHNALHSWMEDLYTSRGGDDVFNCIPLLLESSDLDAWEKAINNRELKPGGGFFFGATDYTEEDWEWHKADDLRAIKAAREAIADGLAVYYDSWW